MPRPSVAGRAAVALVLSLIACGCAVDASTPYYTDPYALEPDASARPGTSVPLPVIPMSDAGLLPAD